MEILKPAMAGTLESSDAQVMVEPGEDGIELSLESSVMNQYGRQIKATVLETLERLGVENARVAVVARIDEEPPAEDVRGGVRGIVAGNEIAGFCHFPLLLFSSDCICTSTRFDIG